MCRNAMKNFLSALCTYYTRCSKQYERRKKIPMMVMGLEGRKHTILERGYLEDHTNGGSNPISSIYSCVIFSQFCLVLWASVFSSVKWTQYLFSGLSLRMKWNKLQWTVEQLLANSESTEMLMRAAAAAKSLQSCPTLCDPIDSSPPGSPIPGILQARTLEWVAISFSNAWKWKVKVRSPSRIQLLATPWTAAHQAPPSMGFSRQEYWSES